MALTINTNIKNDADGYLVDADSVKVSAEKMLNEYLNDLETAAKTTIDSPLQTNTIYDLGMLTTDIVLNLPADAGSGELIYVCYTNTNYAVSIVGNVIGSVLFKPNCFSELMFLRIGDKWSAAYRGTVV